MSTIDNDSRGKIAVGGKMPEKQQGIFQKCLEQITLPNVSYIFNLIATIIIIILLNEPECRISGINRHPSSSRDKQIPPPDVDYAQEEAKITNLLEREFPQQNEIFISNFIISYTESILKKKDPSVIILVSDENSAKSHCIARRVVQTYGDKNLPELDGNEFKGMPSEEAKIEIDKRLVKTFKNSKNKYFMIKNMENIPGNSMLIFHGYGDIGNNAKFPGVVIFLTYNLPKKLSHEERQIFIKSPKRLTQYVEGELKQLWKDIDFDRIYPLFARITKNVVFVEHEELPCRSSGEL